MAVGYQKSTTNGIAGLNFASRSIDGPYVDGISITFGTPRKHIWTYAMGYGYQVEHTSNCPCSEFTGRLPPSFVHETTTVNPVEILVQSLLFSQPILCGMVKVAPVEIIVVLNPACHGSIVLCH